MIIIDTNIWLSYINADDTNHSKALKLLPEIISKHEKLFVTDYIVVETINYIVKRKDRDTAFKVLKTFERDEKIQIIFNDETSFRSTKEIMKNYDSLSFTDANIVVQMQLSGIKELASFDSGFDKVKEIERIH